MMALFMFQGKSVHYLSTLVSDARDAATEPQNSGARDRKPLGSPAGPLYVPPLHR